MSFINGSDDNVSFLKNITVELTNATNSSLISETNSSTSSSQMKLLQNVLNSTSATLKNSFEDVTSRNVSSLMRQILSQLLNKSEDEYQIFGSLLQNSSGAYSNQSNTTSAPDTTPIYTRDWNGSMYPSGYSTITIILTSIFLTAMMIIVVVGNMLVCIAIATEKSLKTTHNSFIASLAVSDLLLGLIVMPFSLASDLMGYWIFGVIWCEMWLAIDVLLCTASILNLCLISLDRYWSITQAVEYLKKRTPRRAASMIIFVWVFAGIVSLPPLVGWKDVKTHEQYPKCFVSRDIGYVLYSAAGSFYIPAVVMVFVYIQIFFAARSRAFRNVKRRPQYPEITNDPMRDKSTTTTTTTTTSFSNTSPPDSSKLSSSPSDASKATIFFRKFPNLTKKKSGKSNDVSKDKNCNTSNSVAVSQIDKDSSHTSPQNCNKMQQDVEIKPIVTDKIFSLGVGELKSIGKNALVAEPRELSEICEDGEDGSQTISSEVEEATNMSVYEKSNTINHKSKRIGNGLFCCVTFEHSAGNGTLNKTRDRTRKKSKKKKKKNYRDKKHQQNFPEKCIHTAADSERMKRRLARAKERRATLILGLIMASFILCWLPFFTTYVVQAIIDKEVAKWAFVLVFWLGYCNSALNPIIYTIFNRDFRKAFRKILFK